MPLSPSPDPPLPGQPTPAWLSSALSDSAHNPDPTGVFATLRQTLVASTQPPDLIFLAITDAARVLTGASGTALALWTEGVVRCRARSGDIAPELGAALNVDSGISGECLREATALRCDDTQTDDRVDPDVCRHLGVRSIAVVPLRRHDQTIGILEAFSHRPYAFAAEQMDSLLHLAEIVEAAHERELGARDLVRVEPKPALSRPEVFAQASSGADAALFAKAAIFDEPRSPGQLRYWVLAAGIVVLLLASAVAWLSWHQPDGELASSAPVTAAQPVAEDLSRNPQPAAVPFKQAAGRPRARVDKSPPASAPSDPVLQNAAKIETTNGVPPESSGASTVTPAGPASDAASQPATSSSSSESGPSDPPAGVVMVVPDSNESIGKLVAASAGLPTPDIPISGGVTEAALIRKVQPIYPPAARTQRLEGAVVLEATIAEDGSTQDLKVISGLPVLAQAATAAVRQWHYRPSLLNGKPVAVQKQITIVFKAQ